MSALALSFQNTQFDVIDRNQQPWLRSGQIAKALGYSDQSSINRIFARNADEFTDSMSASVKLTDPNGDLQETRIFSLRGCHLLAMFSRTAVAKEFRKWVLDILDHHHESQYGLKQLPEPPTLSALPGKLTLEQQDVIKALVKERAEALPKEMQAGATIRCWSAIKKKFGCTYKEVDSANFVNIISLLSRLPLEGELLSKPEPDDNSISIRMRDGGNLRLTFDQHAEEPQRYFVDAFQGNIYVKALGHDSFSVNIADLPKVLSEPGVVDLKYLPLIAEVCIKRWNAASHRT